MEPTSHLPPQSPGKVNPKTWLLGQKRADRAACVSSLSICTRPLGHGSYTSDILSLLSFPPQAGRGVTTSDVSWEMSPKPILRHFPFAVVAVKSHQPKMPFNEAGKRQEE